MRMLRPRSGGCPSRSPHWSPASPPQTICLPLGVALHSHSILQSLTCLPLLLRFLSFGVLSQGLVMQSKPAFNSLYSPNWPQIGATTPGFVAVCLFCSAGTGTQGLCEPHPRAPPLPDSPSPETQVLLPPTPSPNIAPPLHTRNTQVLQRCLG